LTFSGQIGGGTPASPANADFGLVKTGPATLVLSNSGNTYSGGTVITGGTLSVNGDGALGATTGGIAINGGALSASTGFTLSATRGITLGPTGGTGSGTIDVANGTLVYDGTIANASGGTGTLVVTGSGTLRLGGTSTYSGNTEVRGGAFQVTLQLGADNVLPSGTTVVLGSPFVTGASGIGILDLNGHNLTIAGLHNNGLDRTNNRLVNTSTTAHATLTLNVPTGVTSIMDTQLSNGGSQNNFSLAKDGAGTLVVAATQSGSPPTSTVRYSGTTNVLNGTLQLGGGAVSILPTTTAVTLGSGSNSGTLDLAGQAQTLSGQVTINGVGQTLPALTTAGGGAANRVVNSVGVVPAALTLSVGVTDTFAGSLGAAGQNNFSLTKTGAATLILAGANTYSGLTTVSQGTLQIGNGGSAGTLGTGNVSLASGTTLAFNRGDSVSVPNVIYGAGAVTVQSGTVTLTGTSLYSGGTTVSAGMLLANNTAGSATGTGAVTVNGSSAVLGGTGTVGGPVTVKGGGTLSPGASIGTLAVTNPVTFGSRTDNANAGSAGTFYVQLGSTTTSDRLGITGATNSLTFNTLGQDGTSDTGTEVFVDFSQFSGAAPQLFTVYHYTIGTTTNSTNPILVNGSTVADGGTVAVPVMSNYTTYFPPDPAYLAAPANFSLRRSGTNLMLDFTPVPEPASAVAVLFAGLAGAAAWRRRRARAA
jgi:autotransporter-associated beta strand protein